jgi:hypothetical protein
VPIYLCSASGTVEAGRILKKGKKQGGVFACPEKTLFI